MPRHPPRDDVVSALYELLRKRQLSTPEELAQYAEKMGPEGLAAATFFREHCGRLAAELALQKYDVNRRELSHLNLQDRLAAAEAISIALIPPLPPYVCDAFVGRDGAAVVRLDHHHLPPPFRFAPQLNTYPDIYAANQFARGADLIVFDAYQEEGMLGVRASVFDLLTTCRRDAKLYAHLRPRPDPDDRSVPAEFTCRVEFI